jgi:esterase/lipase
MITLQYNGNFVYEFASNNQSDKLLVVFEGSGWNSSLGEYLSNEWQFTEIGAQIIQILRENHTIIIPEKWNRNPEINYFEDAEARYKYTFENLLECYVTSLNKYLEEHKCSSIVLIGTSEGAAVLPFVYQKINKKYLVKAMIPIAFGGLSILESYKINIQKDEIPQDWRNVYAYAIESSQNIEEYVDSIETNPYGVVYRWLASFINIRPFDYYKDINIPLLFIHGEKDLNMAVESTKYVQENLPKKPFEYIYYKNMKHIPVKYFEMKRFREDIVKWINKHNL